MSASSRKQRDKAALVRELETERRNTFTQTGQVVSKRMLSLAVSKNPAYYSHLIKHPTSFPASDRLMAIREALAGFREVYALSVKLAEKDEADPAVSEPAE